MTVSSTLTLTDNNHLFTYVDGGQSITAEREIEVRVFAPDEPGDYPVVIYSHGHLAKPSEEGSINAAAIAAEGYIVVLPTHLDSADLPIAIRDDFPFGPDATLHRVADVQFLAGELDTIIAELPGYTGMTDMLAIAGHSHGARVASLLTGTTSVEPAFNNLAPGNPYGLSSVADSRFKASVLLSPAGIDEAGGSGFTAASWQDYTVASISITGTADVTSLEPSYQARLDGFNLAPGGNKHAVVLAGATHFDIGGFSASAGETAAVVEAAVLFLDAYVKNDVAALATLQDVAALAADPMIAEAYVRTTVEAGVVEGTADGELLAGSVVSDNIFGFGGADIVSAAAGGDIVFASEGGDIVYGGADDDLALGEAGDDILIGEAGSDVLYGGEATDVLFGGADGDILLGEDGNDTLLGGEQSDTLFGGSAADVLFGEAGDDYILGDDGDDTLLGGEGVDVLWGGVGGDVLFGEGGNDILIGEASVDILLGGDGVDVLYGGDDGDFLYGEAGDDVILGEAGGDFAYGGDGVDLILGEAGTDWLFGGGGVDVLYGGDSADFFQFSSFAEGGDVLADFTSADLLVFSAASFGLGSVTAGVDLFQSFQFAASRPSFAYLRLSGQLFFDADGSTGGQSAVALAYLPANTALASANFLFV